MRTKILLASLALSIGTLSAQNYQVPVSEKNGPTTKKANSNPHGDSLENYQVPEKWFRNAKVRNMGTFGPQCVERFRRHVPWYLEVFSGI